jgi:hypothetical protein
MPRKPNKNVVRIRKDNPFQLLVRSFKENNDMSNVALAELLNMYPASASRIVHGEHIPLMSGFCQVISKLDMSPRQIYYFMEDMSDYYERFNGPNSEKIVCGNKERWLSAADKVCPMSSIGQFIKGRKTKKKTLVDFM